VKLEELNQEIKKCTKCRLSETRNHAVCGEGNVRAKLFLIAQAPGENEDREGKMFIGPSGKVLDELFETVGLDKKKLYMTNLIKCMLPNYRNPKQDEIEICSQYLNREIEFINPEILAPLGYYATKYIFEKYTLPVSARSEFKEVYGNLFYKNGRKVLPLPHPALLIHRPSFREEVIKNYRKLKVVLTECKWYPVCPMKRFYEQGKLSKEWIELYCRGDWESCVRYQMEERGEYHPDRMLPDGTRAKEL
jgi:uracil-DNA glycosylase family 4